MNLKDYVLENQKVITMIKDRVPGDDRVDMYYGTLDYATARFNTILLKLSQDRLLEQQFTPELMQCFKAIQDFYDNVQRYRFWPRFTRPFLQFVLHILGTRRIPKIKNLLDKINN